MKNTQTALCEGLNKPDAKQDEKPIKTFAVTGTFHGSIIYAKSEGDARRAFHEVWNGESITHIKTTLWNG